MTGSTLTALAASPETPTFSSTVSTAAASATVTSPARNTWIPNRLVKTVLENEIAMLRIITRRVIDLSTGVEDLETVSRLLALLSLVSGRITAMQRVQVHLASNQLDE